MNRHAGWMTACTLAVAAGCGPALREVGWSLGVYTCSSECVPFSTLYDSTSGVRPWSDARARVGSRDLCVVKQPTVTWNPGEQIVGPDTVMEEPELLKRYRNAWESARRLPSEAVFERTALQRDHAYLVVLSYAFRPGERYYIGWGNDGGIVAREHLESCGNVNESGSILRYKGAELSRDDWNRWLACVDKMSFWTAPTKVDEPPVCDGWVASLAGRRGASFHEIARQGPTRDDTEVSKRVLAECIDLLKSVAP